MVSGLAFIPKREMKCSLRRQDDKIILKIMLFLKYLLYLVKYDKIFP